MGVPFVVPIVLMWVFEGFGWCLFKCFVVVFCGGCVYFWLLGWVYLVVCGGAVGLHIPDGFLSLPWVVVTYVVAVVYGVVAVSRIRRVWGPGRAAVVTVLAAAVFAAQMLNWPLPGGTSLHFVGGGLAGILLGPWLGFMVLALVLVVQCLVFHDGGITALGANIVNMGIVAVVVGYYVFRLSTRVLGSGRLGRLVGGFLGGWLSITLAGVACGVEIGLSPQFPYGVGVTVPIMGFWHALLGVVEGVVTAFVVDYVYERASSFVVVREIEVETVSGGGAGHG